MTPEMFDMRAKIQEQTVMTVGGYDGLIHVRTVTNRHEIPEIIFVQVPVKSNESSDEIEYNILSYYSLASARQRLRELGEI